MNFFEKYLGDTFELVETLKSSAQDFVAVVYDKRTKRLCVLKQRALNSKPIYQILKELDDAHIPKIYRLFEFDGKLIVVEEHIDGQTLEDTAIYRTELFDEKFVADILLSLCDCLIAFHAKNIVHRDIKPSNIMLTESRAVKLIDFGIARIFKPASRADTELLGTRGYAPPEQFGLFGLGQTDSRSDIYSLGVTIKNLLGEDYRGKLSDILNRCTSPDPMQRFQSAAELRNAILRTQKIYPIKKFAIAAPIFFSIIFFHNVANFGENFQSEVSTPLPEIQTPPEIISETENTPPENSNRDAFNQLTDFVINPPPATTPLPEIPSPIQPAAPAPSIEKISGEVNFKFYLNGELTDKYHMIYFRPEDGWQNWPRNNYGDYLFPPSMIARLRIENHSGKDLINPRIEINFGYDKYATDYPTIASGQSIDLNIPLAGQLAAPKKGNGTFHVTLKAQGEIPLYFNKTFFLVE